MIGKLQEYWWIARGVGLDNVPRRLIHAWNLRSGRLRRLTDPRRYARAVFEADCTEPVSSKQHWRGRRKRFFATPSSAMLRKIADDARWSEQVTTVCELTLDGQYPYFSHWPGELGWPPDFNLDPVNQAHWPTDQHWTQLGHDVPGHDIKLVWEASRFTLAYHLARAYARDGDERWAAAFWKMFDAWVEQNPAQMSAAWACGQETALRLMAMLTGAFVTLNSEHTTDQRLDQLSHLAWQFGRRIEANINYARSQKNNHALSEAMGLFTVGLLFPEFRSAARWRRKGAGVLAAEARRQIYDDGSFVQHSTNYHRVMLDDLIWAIRLGEINDYPLPPIVRDRLGRAVQWLAEMVDPQSGRVPNYGANDGANVLPLSCCDYLDYRPTLQAGWLLAFGQRPLPTGEWDEKALWLLGEGAMEAPAIELPRRAMHIATDGGYYVMRGRRSWAMTRCCTYRDRPSQADMLHLDLWCDGHNILRDGGSFQYNCPQPWHHYFHSTAAHNTVEIDGRDQMIKGPRFLWLRWPRAIVLACESSADGNTSRLVMQHDGYAQIAGGMRHQRTVSRIGDVYLVDDMLTGAGVHEVVLRWRLLPAEWREHAGSSTWQLEHPTDWLMHIAPADGLTTELVAGRAGERPDGWESLYYGRRTPAPTLLIRCALHDHLHMVTLMGPPADITALLPDTRWMSLTAEDLAARFDQAGALAAIAHR